MLTLHAKRRRILWNLIKWNLFDWMLQYLWALGRNKFAEASSKRKQQIKGNGYNFMLDNYVYICLSSAKKSTVKGHN